MNNTITKSECAAMRGIAILAIMLHNYCHFLSFTIKENEYTYHAYYNHYLWQHVFTLNKNLLLDLFSFFGHYGVPIFLFISGYGLVKKYESGTYTIRPTAFIKEHYLKLLRLMLLGFIAFIFIDWSLKGVFRFNAGTILAQLAMVINILPHPDDLILPGPYWYFGLMLQLYIIYRLFLYRKSTTTTLLFVLACCLTQVSCSPTGDTLNWLRYNFMGSMLPFGIGIIYARNEISLSQTSLVFTALLSIALASIFGGYYQLWFYVPIFIIFALVATVKLLPSNLLKPFIWLGGISASIFVIHPLMRPLFLLLAKSDWIYSSIVLYIAATIILAYAYNQLIKYIPIKK